MDKTLEREDKIKSLGYKVVSITICEPGCEWKKNPKVKSIVTPICTYVDIKMQL